MAMRIGTRSSCPAPLPPLAPPPLPPPPTPPPPPPPPPIPTLVPGLPAYRSRHIATEPLRLPCELPSGSKRPRPALRPAILGRRDDHSSAPDTELAKPGAACATATPACLPDDAAGSRARLPDGRATSPACLPDGRAAWLPDGR